MNRVIKSTSFFSLSENPTMVLFQNQNLLFDNNDLKESFFKLKDTDCILYSQEGTEFKIHKDILSQTKFMQKILFSSFGNCCGNLEILCPCPTKDLQHMVDFLYYGKIPYEEGLEKSNILDNLTKIFGYSLIHDENDKLHTDFTNSSESGNDLINENDNRIQIERMFTMNSGNSFSNEGSAYPYIKTETDENQNNYVANNFVKIEHIRYEQ